MSRLIFAVVLALLIARNAEAGYIIGAGDVLILSNPPASVRLNDLESDDFAWVFTEREGFVLETDVDVNITASGFSNGTALTNVTTLPAGTVVDTVFVSFDPVGSPGRSDPFQTAQGRLTFDREVLAVITQDQQLWDSESLGLGSPTTLYPPAGTTLGRKVDAEDLAFDFIDVSADRFSVEFGFAARTPSDQFRILLAHPAPEPSTFTLLGIGLACLVSWGFPLRKK